MLLKNTNTLCGATLNKNRDQPFKFHFRIDLDDDLVLEALLYPLELSFHSVYHISEIVLFTVNTISTTIPNSHILVSTFDITFKESISSSFSIFMLTFMVPNRLTMHSFHFQCHV